MIRALQSDGVDALNRVQLQRLENESLSEATAAVAQLRARRDVDARRIGVVGHSFGGSLSLLMLERDPQIRAAVIFGGAANSWNQSPVLRASVCWPRWGGHRRRRSFVYAENDYSTTPGRELAAEMKRLGKAHALEIDPPFGDDARTGHNLIFAAVATWERTSSRFWMSIFGAEALGAATAGLVVTWVPAPTQFSGKDRHAGGAVQTHEASPSWQALQPAA